MNKFYKNLGFAASGNAKKQCRTAFFFIAKLCDAFVSRLLFFRKNDSFGIFSVYPVFIRFSERFLLEKFEHAFFFKAFGNGFSRRGKIAYLFYAGGTCFGKKINNFFLFWRGLFYKRFSVFFGFVILLRKPCHFFGFVTDFSFCAFFSPKNSPLRHGINKGGIGKTKGFLYRCSLGAVFVLSKPVYNTLFFFVIRSFAIRKIFINRFIVKPRRKHGFYRLEKRAESLHRKMLCKFHKFFAHNRFVIKQKSYVFKLFGVALKIFGKGKNHALPFLSARSKRHHHPAAGFYFFFHSFRNGIIKKSVKAKGGFINGYFCYHIKPPFLADLLFN